MKSRATFSKLTLLLSLLKLCIFVVADRIRHHERFPIQSRIVGGQNALRGEYPWFIKWSRCAATLIHDDIALTAAHCNGLTSSRVYIGAYTKTGFATDGTPRTIVRRRPHPGYVSRSQLNDFMVVKLSSPVVGVTPIPLNTNITNPTDGETLTVIGFGKTRENGPLPSTLQETEVNYIPHGRCNSAYGGIQRDIMFCAGVQGGGKDSCQGDSGGPILEKVGDKYVQVGVVSFGIGCGRARYPGVYARTSGVIDWINQQICQLSSRPPDFCNGLPPVSIPSLPPPGPIPGNGNIQVRVDVMADRYPREVGWSIRQGGRPVFAKPFGSINKPGLNSWTLSLSSGEGYTFSIADSFGDGTCCRQGSGRFDVVAVSGEKEVTLVEGSGNYGRGIVRTFQVPKMSTPNPTPTPSPTPAPTPNPGGSFGSATPFPTPLPTPSSNSSQVFSNSELCVDSSESFLIDSNFGTRTCAWLKENLSRFQYLCRFLDVAIACPLICNACEKLRLKQPTDNER